MWNLRSNYRLEIRSPFTRYFFRSFSSSPPKCFIYDLSSTISQLSYLLSQIPRSCSICASAILFWDDHDMIVYNRNFVDLLSLENLKFQWELDILVRRVGCWRPKLVRGNVKFECVDRSLFFFQNREPSFITKALERKISAFIFARHSLFS